MSTAFESIPPYWRFNFTFARQILFTPLRHTQRERPFVFTKPNSDKKAVHLLPSRPAPPFPSFFSPSNDLMGAKSGDQDGKWRGRKAQNHAQAFGLEARQRSPPEDVNAAFKTHVSTAFSDSLA